MKFAILALVFLASLEAVFGYSARDCPHIDSPGGIICLSCKYTGECLGTDGVVTARERCQEGEYCQDGECVALDEPPAACGCHGGNGCYDDPFQPAITATFANPPSAYIDCRNSASKPNYPLCPDHSEAISIAPCGCVEMTCTDTTASDVCVDPDASTVNYYLGPPGLNDGCEEYFSCEEELYNIGLVPIECMSGQCFDVDVCDCVPSSGGGGESPCPDCGKVPDPDNEFGYLECVPGQPGLIITGKKDCEEYAATFHEETCECKLTCPSGCSFRDDPSPACYDYINCETGEIFGCAYEGECFNPDTCDCENTAPPSTTVPPGSDCPPCGKKKDPDDSHKFFVCSPTGEFGDDPCTCYDKYFAQEGCECLACQTCIDDPYSDDCGHFYECFDDEFVKSDCGGGDFCYNLATCACEVAGGTTPPSACGPGCNKAPSYDPDCYLSCDNLDAQPVCCPDGYTYDVDYCGCVEKDGLSSTLPPPTTSEPPHYTCGTPNCPFFGPWTQTPFLDDFRFCLRPLYRIECPRGLIWNQSLCKCYFH